MIKKMAIAVITALTAAPAFAGGLLTNTNQSVHFLRNPARNASTEIDAVYTNPAGLTFLSDGLHLSLTSQSAFQTRTITSTFAPFAYSNNGNPTKVFKGEASAPIIPSFQLAYKNDKFVFSTSFAVTGGGGKAIFNHGLPSFEAGLSVLPAALTAKGITTTTYTVDAYMEGQQYIFGWQLNGSYKISDNLSAALGMRLNIVNNKYVGHLRNIMINPTHPVLNPTSALMSANTFFTNAAAGATSTATTMAGIESQGYGSATLDQLVAANKLTSAQVQQLAQGLGVTAATAGAMTVTAVKTGYNTVAATNTATAAAVADKNLESTQSGWGVTPIVSINYHVGDLNLAARYEFLSSLNVQNKTKIDDTGLYADGVNTPHDIPALLSLGAEYEFFDKLKISAGYHHFFDSDAKMANNKQQYINGGVNEYLFGAEYKFTERFLLSAGGQITRTGVTDAYQSDMSFSLNSYSIGFGGAFSITEKLRLNLAYFFTNYEDWTKVSTSYNGTSLAGTDVFARTNKVFGIGVDYKF
ncbi:MAG: OmpP1/FadL family transporter [Paludibacter sp.]